VIWIDDDSLVIRHSNDGGVTLLTFLGTIKIATSSSSTSVIGSYLDGEVVAITARPGGKEPSLFYLVKNVSGVVGILAESDGKNPKHVWSSPLSGWRVSWVSEDRIALSQKSAQGIVGSAYILSPTKKDLSLVVGNKDGLVALPHPTKDAVIYSTAENGVLKLYSRIDGLEKELPIATLADKCVWGGGKELVVFCAVPLSLPKEALPDAWYRGEVVFSDHWFAVNLVSGTATLLVDPLNEFGSSIDVVNPIIDAAGKRLLFTDQATGASWIFSI
jgi:hypothetical protein